MSSPVDGGAGNAQSPTGRIECARIFDSEIHLKGLAFIDQLESFDHVQLGCVRHIVVGIE